MTDGRSDVAVIGGGIMGLSIAYAVARQGKSVTLFEAETLTHEHGGSHGKARIIRLSYDDPFYVGLAQEAFEAWHALGSVARKDLYKVTGSLDIDLSGQRRFDGHRDALAECGVSSKLMSATEINDAYPELNLPDEATGLWQHRSAVLNADLCSAALADEARRYGAHLWTGCKVNRVIPDDRIRLDTTQGMHHADTVVIATGDQVARFASDLGTHLPLTKSLEEVSFYEPLEPEAHLADHMPLLIFHLGNGVLSSVFPIHRDAGVKIMVENNGRDTSPPERLTEHKVAEIAETILPVLPRLPRAPSGTNLCHYILTPNGDFILDRLPGHPQIIMCSACSGHGFKFAPVLGEMVAQLITSDFVQPSLFMISNHSTS